MVFLTFIGLESISYIRAETFDLFGREVLKQAELAEVGYLAFETAIVTYLTGLIEVDIWVTAKLTERQSVYIQLCSVGMVNAEISQSLIREAVDFKQLGHRNIATKTVAIVHNLPSPP